MTIVSGGLLGPYLVSGGLASGVAAPPSGGPVTLVIGGLLGPDILTDGLGVAVAVLPSGGPWTLVTRGLLGPFILTRGLGEPVPVIPPTGPGLGADQWAVDADFGYRPCGPTDPRLAAWLPDIFGGKCVVVQGNST